MTFNKPYNFVAAVTYGLGGIGNRSVYSFMPQLEEEIAKEGRLLIQEYAEKLSSFFMREWDKRPPEMNDYKGDPMFFVIGGFNEGELLSHTYEIRVPSKPKPVELPHTDVNWGGMGELVNRLVNGIDPNLARKLSQASSLKDA